MVSSSESFVLQKCRQALFGSQKLWLLVHSNNVTCRLVYTILSLSSLFIGAEAQIIIIPKIQVQEPFKNNPKWESFKIAQYDRVKVLGTLVSNVWTFLDSVEEPSPDLPVNGTFVKYHVRAFVEFFSESEARLVHSNPYAIIDPAIGIHTLESLYRLSNMPANKTLEKLRVKWMEVDTLALSLHLFYNETTKLLLNNQPQDVLKIPDVVIPAWTTEGENGTWKNMSVEDISKYIDEQIDAQGNENHMIRGLVKLLMGMVQPSVDYRPDLNYYCYGNNEFGVFEDIYDILTDAALYLTMMDMKKLVLDVYFHAYTKFFQPGNSKNELEERKALFREMVTRIKRKIGFSYLDGSDYSELPHPPIFKCDKPPEEAKQVPSQWGRSVTTGISPAAGATYPYDPQAGPEKEDGNVGYLDDRHPTLEYVQFSKSFHGYLESELVLNPLAICRGTCRDYKRPTKTCEGKDCRELRGTHCDPANPDCMDLNQCPEYARNCIRSSHTVEMCLSQDNSRYYSHFNYPPDNQMGKGNQTKPVACGGESRRAKERWEMEFGPIIRGPQYCELCLCTCLSPQSPADQHYIDLQPALADLSAGFVVSAVRFSQEDNILRLGIEQGKPLKGGDIDLTSTSWVQTKSADKNDGTQVVPLGLHGFMRMNFDIVVGEPDQVVTGVRFKLHDQSVSLEVQVTPISWPASDPTKISLNGGQSSWIATQEYPNVPKKPLTFYKPDSPAIQKGPSMPDVVYNSYVEFATSDYEQDLAQSTIPFFDTQPVHHYDTKRWLQGVGIMHKGKPESGGFIAPIIVPSKGNKSSLDSSNSP